MPEETDERSVQLSLGRLVFSRQEVDSIYSQFPAAQTSKFVDFGASLPSVTSPNLSQYRIIHLATHGLLDSEHPERSALVMSLVDRFGNSQPGFLKMGDVFNLKLPADLVVLSACETALGSDIKGEGLVGLTRAFMYAGARRIVASSWKVDDLATAELMTSFYKNLAQGQSAPVALRAAKLGIMQKPGWSSPYYWAAFTLQGEFDNKPIIRMRHE
jgi:CHAT domain-containing protein